MKDFLFLVIKFIYNLFRRPQSFFKYLNISNISEVFRCLRENGKNAATNRLNELLLGMHSGDVFFCRASKDASDVFISCKCFRIITPNHSFFVAKLMEAELKKLDIDCEILSRFGGKIPFDAKSIETPHIVISPQIFALLPPFCITMQMEQTVSSRWLNPRYVSILQQSFETFDYSLENIDYFSKYEGLNSKLFYYLPLDYLAGYSPDSSDDEKEIDVLFYGDDSAERRLEILKQLKPDFKIKIVSNLFGEDMLELVRKSKIVLNIHYYEGALLETTRLYEVLSQNSSIIISERSADIFEDKRLEEFVDFVDIGDVEAIRNRITYWLSNEDERIAKIKSNNERLRSKKSDFSFFFMRALLANEVIDFKTFYKYQKDYFCFESERVCLGLIESKESRELFTESAHGFKHFLGLRHKEEREGEALSLKFLKRKAEEEGLVRLIVCKEDVLSSPDFEAELDSLLSESPQKSTELISQNLDIRVFFLNTDKKSISNSTA